MFDSVERGIVSVPRWSGGETHPGRDERDWLTNVQAQSPRHEYRILMCTYRTVLGKVLDENRRGLPQDDRDLRRSMTGAVVRTQRSFVEAK